MQVEYTAHSSVGTVRRKNEDNIYINGFVIPQNNTEELITQKGKCDLAYQIYAVCDGMGGHDAGEVASFTAVSLLGEYHKEILHGANAFDTLSAYTDFANKQIVNLPDARDAGTTLALICISMDGVAFTAHLGDSRCYLARNKDLFLLTSDHTEAERMKKLGIKDAHGGALTRYLGMNIEGIVVTPTFSKQLPLKNGDAFLICSDGLYNAVSADEIRHIIYNDERPSKALIDKAIDNHGTDNITAVTVKVHC